MKFKHFLRHHDNRLPPQPWQQVMWGNWSGCLVKPMNGAVCLWLCVVHLAVVHSNRNALLGLYLVAVLQNLKHTGNFAVDTSSNEQLKPKYSMVFGGFLK